MTIRPKGEVLVSKKYAKRSQFGELLHRLKRNKGAVVGLFVIGILLLLLISTLFISYEAVTSGKVSERLSPPSLQHLFGTDYMGRDLFLRTIYGTRYSLVIGIGASILSSVIGVTLGSIAGYYGRIVEDIIMRASDVLASIPGMLLGMVIVTVLGTSLQNLIIAVGICAVTPFIRITRASIISIKNQEYVEAAKAIGMSNFRLLFTEILPNGFSPIIVTFTAGLGTAIIVAASLSFLGFGIPVPQPEWGALISDGRNYIRTSPYLMTFPGLFIMITVLAFNLVGDGLRDALDPKLKS